MKYGEVEVCSVGASTLADSKARVDEELLPLTKPSARSRTPPAGDRGGADRQHRRRGQ